MVIQDVTSGEEVQGTDKSQGETNNPTQGTSSQDGGTKGTSTQELLLPTSQNPGGIIDIFEV